MHITPEMVEAAYELARTMPPFRGWKLPHPDHLEFGILTTKERFGHFRWHNEGQHELSFSASCIGSSDVLMRTMMHELCHFEAHRRGYRGEHGGTWRELANQVCRIHHLDPKAF